MRGYVENLEELTATGQPLPTEPAAEWSFTCRAEEAPTEPSKPRAGFTTSRYAPVRFQWDSDERVDATRTAKRHEWATTIPSAIAEAGAYFQAEAEERGLEYELFNGQITLSCDEGDTYDAVEEVYHLVQLPQEEMTEGAAHMWNLMVTQDAELEQLQAVVKDDERSLAAQIIADTTELKQLKAQIKLVGERRTARLKAARGAGYSVAGLAKAAGVTHGAFFNSLR